MLLQSNSWKEKPLKGGFEVAQCFFVLVEPGAQRGSAADDRNRDQAGKQGIFDSDRAGLVFEKTGEHRASREIPPMVISECPMRAQHLNTTSCLIQRKGERTEKLAHFNEPYGR